MILILAQISEIEPETAKQSSVVAVKKPVQPTNHGPLQAPEDVLSPGAADQLLRRTHGLHFNERNWSIGVVE
jgi:hypothetical protein